MTKKQRKCPQCQSKNVVEILYGMPTKEAFDDAEEGKLLIGGCCISEDSPEWYCNDCEHEFGKLWGSMK